MPARALRTVAPRTLSLLLAAGLAAAAWAADAAPTLEAAAPAPSAEQAATTAPSDLGRGLRYLHLGTAPIDEPTSTAALAAPALVLDLRLAAGDATNEALVRSRASRPSCSSPPRLLPTAPPPRRWRRGARRVRSSKRKSRSPVSTKPSSPGTTPTAGARPPSPRRFPPPPANPPSRCRTPRRPYRTRCSNAPSSSTARCLRSAEFLTTSDPCQPPASSSSSAQATSAAAPWARSCSSTRSPPNPSRCVR